MTAVMALPAINLGVKICTLFKEEAKVLPVERGKMNNRICSPVPRRECLKICYGNRRYRCGGLRPRDIFQRFNHLTFIKRGNEITDRAAERTTVGRRTIFRNGRAAASIHLETKPP